MTFTYTGDPASSDRDAVRFWIGDTDDDNVLLSDEEIAYANSVHGNVFFTSAALCEQLAATGNSITGGVLKVGDLQEDRGSLSDHFNSLAKSLRRKGMMQAVPIVGGTSIADKQSAANDTDLPSPSFTRGQFDHPQSNLPGDGGRVTYTGTT